MLFSQSSVGREYHLTVVFDEVKREVGLALEKYISLYYTFRFAPALAVERISSIALNLKNRASNVSNESSFDFSANIYFFYQDVQSCGAIVVEPIAVTGLSLKFPQDAISTGSFNTMLMEGRCAVTDIPKDRINLDAFYSTDANRKDTVQLTKSTTF